MGNAPVPALKLAFIESSLNHPFGDLFPPIIDLDLAEEGEQVFICLSNGKVST